MLGPHFGAELLAADLAGLPIAWAADGTITGRDDLTSAQRAALDGVVAAHDPTATKTAGQWWDDLRAARDKRLAAALALLDRHRNQRDFGLPATLTDEQAAAWAVYAQALRDLPENTADPADPDWPEVPA